MRNILIAFVAALCFISCESKMSPKHILLSGDLKPYFEVINRDYTIADGKSVIEFRRIKEGMPAGWTQGMNLGTNSGEFEIGLTVEYSDSKGVLFRKETTDIARDANELRMLVNTKTGESATVTFMAPSDATTFCVVSNFTSHAAVSTHQASVPQPVVPRDPNHVQLAGNLAKAGKIYMTLDFNGSAVSESYYYASTKSPLYISGSRSGSHIELTETNGSGEVTGEFSGTYTGSAFSGTMTSYYSKSMGVDYSSPHYHSFNLSVY